MFLKDLNEISKILIKLILFITIIYMIFLPLGVTAVLHTVRITTLAAMLLIFIAVYSNERFIISCGQFLSVSVFICLIVGNFIVYQIPLNIDNILSVVSISALMMLVSISDKIIIDRSLINFAYYCGMIMAFVQIIYSFTEYAHWDGTRTCIYLTLGVSNSNMAAIQLFLIYSLLVITMRGRQSAWLAILVELYLMWLMWLTYSRMVLVAAILLVVITFARKVVRVPRVIVWGIFALPFVFVSIYLLLYTMGMEDFDFMGKDFFSGRQNVYRHYLSYIGTPMTALFGNIKANMFQNAHNGPLSVITAIGLVGGFAYFYVLFDSLNRAVRNCASPIAAAGIVSILACFVHACGESSLFLGGFPGIVFVFAMFLFAHAPREGEY